jgi:hypothetical protein
VVFCAPGCCEPAVHQRLLMAGKNRPADGFDGQVSVMELPFERR